MDQRQREARDRAVHTLAHYICLLLSRTAGGGDHGGNSDTVAEIAGVVDDIIEACSEGVE